MEDTLVGEIQIIRRVIFKLKPNTTDPELPENRIILKDFIYQVLSPDREKLQLEQLKLTYRHMPITNYDPALTNYVNQLNYAKITPKPLLSTLDPQSLIYTSSYLSTATGCPHYVRNCSKLCATCNHLTPCRICHDEVSNHEFPRRKTPKFHCSACQKLSKPGQFCEFCGLKFGEFYCQICQLVCGIGAEAKPNYHCVGCGCCMVGIEGENQHCGACNGCYSNEFFGQHKCVAEVGNCAVCLGELKHSIYGYLAPNCGHFLHEHCYDELMAEGIFSCPVCRRFLPVEGDVEFVRKHYLEVYGKTFMCFPERAVGVQCNDCMGVFVSFEHQELYYCCECDNFNCQVVSQAGSLEEAEKYYEQSKVKGLKADCDGVKRFFDNLEFEQEVDRVAYVFNKLQISDLKDRFLIVAKVANSQLFSSVDEFMSICALSLKFGIDFDALEAGEDDFWYEEED